MKLTGPNGKERTLNVPLQRIGGPLARITGTNVVKKIAGEHSRPRWVFEGSPHGSRGAFVTRGCVSLLCSVAFDGSQCMPIIREKNAWHTILFSIAIVLCSAALLPLTLQIHPFLHGLLPSLPPSLPVPIANIESGLPLADVAWTQPLSVEAVGTAAVRCCLDGVENLGSRSKDSGGTAVLRVQDIAQMVA